MPKLITYHPTFAFFYDPYEAGTFLVDLKHFSQMVKGDQPEKMSLITKPTLKQVQKACSKGYVAVDIETAPASEDQIGYTGKDPTRALLNVIGLGTEQYAVSLYWKETDPQIRSYIAQVLGDAAITKVFHNGIWFDLRVLQRYGLNVLNVEDTRDMRRAQSVTSYLSLRYLASIYDFTNNWKKGDEEEDSKGIVFTKDRKKLLKYNAQDCIETARVYRGLKSETWDKRTERLYEIHKRMSGIYAEMHTTGVYLIKENRQFMLHCLEQSISERTDVLKALVNVDGFEATADHMRAIIYKRHEWVKTVGKVREGTKRQCIIKKFSLPDPLNKKMYTDETLETIKVDEPSLLLLIASGECPPELIKIIDAWWNLQTEIKQRGYIASEDIDHALGLDGRVRPSWNSCGTETMRVSCSEPPMMVYKQVIRNMFGPPEGKIYIHADKSQLELRVMEIITNDAALKAALDTGDVYSFDARKWFNLPADLNVKKMKPQARQASKIIHLASQYGAGDATIYAQALMEDRNFKFNAVRLLSKQFKATYHVTCSWWFEQMKEVMECGYSHGRLLDGRIYYPAPPELSEVANYPIQRTASEMMNLELITLYDRLKVEVPTAKIIITLHDAFDVECFEEDEETVCRIMKEVMDREWTIEGRTRKFPVEMKVARHSNPAWKGNTWGDV